MANKAKSVAERKQQERERKKSAGLVRHDIWAHPSDWPQIKELVESLLSKRLNNN